MHLHDAPAPSFPAPSCHEHSLQAHPTAAAALLPGPPTPLGHRPATDPAVLAGILGAAAEGFDVWELQQRLPGLELREPGRSASPWTGSSGSAPRRQRQRMLAAPEHSYGDAAGSDNEASLSAAMDADGSDSQEEASFSCGSSGSGNDMLRRSGGGGAARPAYSDTSIGTMSTDASALRPWEEGRDGWPRMQQPAATGQQVR